VQQGFVPCFSYYCFNRYPILGLYSNQVYVEKLRQLLRCALVVVNPTQLCKQFGVGKEIQPIRPTDHQSKRIIRDAGGYPYQMYRIDYGDMPFRIVFGIQPNPRIIHIIMIDTKHKTYSGKIKR